MGRTFVLLTAVLALAGIVASAPPAAEPWRGTGVKNCLEEIQYSLPDVASELLWDPATQQWILCPDDQVAQLPSVEINCDLEMECVFAWDYTCVDIHLASYYEDVCVVFTGQTSCNNSVNLVVVPPPGESLSHLPFVSNVEGGPGVEADIPLNWRYRIDEETFQPLLAGPDGMLYFPVEACSHQIAVEICLDLEFHQADGYYAFGEGGFFCLALPI